MTLVSPSSRVVPSRPGDGLRGVCRVPRSLDSGRDITRSCDAAHAIVSPSVGSASLPPSASRNPRNWSPIRPAYRIIDPHSLVLCGQAHAHEVICICGAFLQSMPLLPCLPRARGDLRRSPQRRQRLVRVGLASRLSACAIQLNSCSIRLRSRAIRPPAFCHDPKNPAFCAPVAAAGAVA